MVWAERASIGDDRRSEPVKNSLLPNVTTLPPGGSMSHEFVEEEDHGWFRATARYTITRTSTNCIQYTPLEPFEDCILWSNWIASDFSRDGTGGGEGFPLQYNCP
jgi:hypothetical protein